MLGPMLLLFPWGGGLAANPHPDRADRLPSAESSLPTVTVEEPDESGTPPLSTSGVTSVDHGGVIASEERSLSDVLRGLAGLGLHRSGRGGPHILSLRGASAGQGLLMFDGIPLYSPVPGSFNLDALPVEAVERVELVRGSAAQLYGSHALGGTIRLFSREAKEDHAFLHIEGGSFGTLQETVGAGLVGTGGRIALTASRDDLFDGIPFADPANGNPERDPFHASQGILRFATEPSAVLAVDGSLRYARSRADMDRPGLLPDGEVGFVDDPNAFFRNDSWLAQSTARLALAPH